MRTFIAIPLPSECQSMLEQMQSSLRSLGADVRWTAIPSIHLTLKFLGEVDPAVLPQLKEALEGAACQPAFRLQVRGLGGFPSLHNPRVIWCGIEGELERLAVLQGTVEKACAILGFAAEDRPFQPHLTLGRVQGKKNLQPLLNYIRIGSGLECAFTVDHFNIYQSVLTPRGAKYTILEKLAFK